MSDVRIFGDNLFMLKSGIRFRHAIQTKLVSSTERYTFLGAFAKLRKASISFIMSVHPSARNNSAPTGRTFMTFDNWVFFENLSRKFKCN